MAPAAFPWYAITQGKELQQGDILLNCLAPLPPSLTQQPPTEVEQHPRVLVLTQSCDLVEDRRVDRVMVCPITPASTAIQAAGGADKRKNFQRALEKGRLMGHVLLNKCDLAGHEFEHLMTDFPAAFSIPMAYADELAGSNARVRMLPPYREYVSQAFGLYYMRVGLPLNVAALP